MSKDEAKKIENQAEEAKFEEMKKNTSEQPVEEKTEKKTLLKRISQKICGIVKSPKFKIGVGLVAGFASGFAGSMLYDHFNGDEVVDDIGIITGDDTGVYQCLPGETEWTKVSDDPNDFPAFSTEEEQKASEENPTE